MNRRPLHLVLGLMVALAVPGVSSPSAGDGPALGIELNNAEQTGKACRLSFLFANKLGAGLEKLSMQIVVFGKDERIRNLVTLSAGALPRDKRRVRQFDLPGTDCGEVARILLNDLPACEGAGIEAGSCMTRLEISNRSAIEFVL